MVESDSDNIILTEQMGRRIRAAREAAGLSVLELAGKIAASSSQVRAYEKGNYTIAIERLFQIATILQITVSQIFDA